MKNTLLPFSLAVIAQVKKIPKGSVRSYGEIASDAGFPGAARAVGNLMKKNFAPDIPCHRVIRRNGLLGKYNRGTQKKALLLKSEGVRWEKTPRGYRVLL